MNSNRFTQRTARRLLRYGALLFFLGLLTGLVVPLLANPRVGLSSHLEGVMNGLLLLALGLLWPRLRLSRSTLTFTFWLVLYGTYINWGTTLAAAAWGIGETLMPIAAVGYRGTPLQELLIGLGLGSLTLAMLVTCAIVLWGLRGTDQPVDTEAA
jgi:hydroxylaminobenzene mutase